MALYQDIHSKLATKMEENRKFKKTIKFGYIRKGMYIYLNTGSFHNLQPLDHDKWNSFKYRGLHLLHLNINSLLPKIDEIRHIARLTNIAVIGISESKLDSVPTSEIQIDKYDLLCCDRNRYGGEWGGGGGGSLLYQK